MAFKRNESLHVTRSLRQLQRAAQPARPVLVANALVDEKRHILTPTEWTTTAEMSKLIVCCYWQVYWWWLAVITRWECTYHRRSWVRETVSVLRVRSTTGSTPVPRSSSLRRSLTTTTSRSHQTLWWRSCFSSLGDTALNPVTRRDHVMCCTLWGSPVRLVLASQTSHVTNNRWVQAPRHMRLVRRRSSVDTAREHGCPTRASS